MTANGEGEVTMHDPKTVAFDIRLPWPGRQYGIQLATIWHCDPERDGTDDSCGWFPRARHGNQATLERIIKSFEREFDDVYRSDSGRVYLRGLFAPNGEPHFSVSGIVLNLFFRAANEVFRCNGRTNWKTSRRWMQRHLFDLLFFAENTTDSLRDSITRTFEIGCGEKYTPEARSERIRALASSIYGWILRAERPWWKHPRWHVWHWRLQFHPWQNLKRRWWDKCCLCGKRGFKTTALGTWGGDRMWHQECDHMNRVPQPQ